MVGIGSPPITNAGGGGSLFTCIPTGVHFAVHFRMHLEPLVFHVERLAARASASTS